MTGAVAALDASRGHHHRASAPKFTISRVGAQVAQRATRLHDGVGETDGLPPPRYAKRLVMPCHRLGDKNHSLARSIELADA